MIASRSSQSSLPSFSITTCNILQPYNQSSERLILVWAACAEVCHEVIPRSARRPFTFTRFACEFCVLRHFLLSYVVICCHASSARCHVAQVGVKAVKALCNFIVKSIPDKQILQDPEHLERSSERFMCRRCSYDVCFDCGMHDNCLIDRSKDSTLCARLHERRMWVFKWPIRVI